MRAEPHAALFVGKQFEPLVLLWGRWIAPHLLLAMGGLLALYVLAELQSNGWQWQALDELLISGLLTYIIGVRAAGPAGTKLNKTLDQLADRNVMDIPDVKRAKFEVYAHRWSYVGGTAVAALMLGGFFGAFGGWTMPQSRVLLTSIAVIAGFVAGRLILRMVVYGLLGKFVEREHILVKAEPGHVDGAAGLKPIGDFYFYQAMVTAIPVLFLGIWLVIFALWHDNPYSHWYARYVLYLMVGLAAELGAFLVPIWLFHRLMVRRKDEYAHEANQCSREISDLETKLAKPLPEERRKKYQETIDYKTKRYTNIDTMPTWPIDTELRRRFTFSNLGLTAIPLLGELFSGNDIVQGWLTAISESLKSIKG